MDRKPFRDHFALPTHPWHSQWEPAAPDARDTAMKNTTALPARTFQARTQPKYSGKCAEVEGFTKACGMQGKGHLVCRGWWEEIVWEGLQREEEVEAESSRRGTKSPDLRVGTLRVSWAKQEPIKTHDGKTVYDGREEGKRREGRRKMMAAERTWPSVTKMTLCVWTHLIPPPLTT